MTAERVGDGSRPARSARSVPTSAGEVEGEPQSGLDLGERVEVERADPVAELVLVEGDDLRDVDDRFLRQPRPTGRNGDIAGCCRKRLLLIATATAVPIRLRLNESADTTSTGRRLPGPCGIPARSRPLLLLSQPFGPALKPSISAVSDKR